MAGDRETFGDIWNAVVADLSSGAGRGDTPPLTQQQKAWLSLVRPLTMTEGFALLAVPSAVVQEQIERNLRDTVRLALSNHVGQSVDIAVRVSEPEEAPAAPAPTGPVSGDAHPQPGVTGATQVTPETYGMPSQYDLPAADAHPFPTPTYPASPAIPSDEQLAALNYQQQYPQGPPARPVEPREWSSYFEQRETSAPDNSTTALHPKYTFDTYVIGASNRFAHASAVAVAENPARAYNPLFIWGESGLGKTHLLHAAGHYAQRLFPGMRVKYVSTEEFTNDFINSLRDDRRVAFKRRYRDIDMLLIDDIQFLEGKEGIQEEFFHTFNTLHNANKQIVVSSDRPPKQLATLEDRLRTRFEWGLITDVQPPDLETRIAILRKKAQMDKLAVPDEVLELIASKIERNIRELEGALIRVTAFASLNNTELDISLAEVVLKALIPDSGPMDISAASIVAVTADFFGLAIDDFTGPSKVRSLTLPRQISMYLCRELTDLSLPKIGETFDRDHTTVMHADKKIRKLLHEDRSIYDQVQELTARIKQRANR
ncbi:chromosomal replication initiator protein DnaA [Gordonia sp. (in: high G+C Gram-positive bacteria)]|uniref:chromosomal replication initiator protein DnaA n=1 Tax=Gordonia sp. (in: high G+C Gram-positive bacteria) TaxID=84139 RepID=UPI0016B50573|nr:chromosomal replication initiator protein DnaA [Gordonia sp. (in: high G+C Gram-positive bacteria)]NLG47777.1 chromosomal replication initiator protein DnaA [Gordonia sp. (in: high G+C Gram-positive bacteria)]